MQTCYKPRPIWRIWTGCWWGSDCQGFGLQAWSRYRRHTHSAPWQSSSKGSQNSDCRSASAGNKAVFAVFNIYLMQFSIFSMNPPWFAIRIFGSKKKKQPAALVLDWGDGNGARWWMLVLCVRNQWLWMGDQDLKGQKNSNAHFRKSPLNSQ